MSQPTDKPGDGLETPKVIFRIVDVFQQALDALSPLVRRRVFSELFKGMPEGEQIRFLRELVGCLPSRSRRLKIAAVDAARLLAIDTAARATAVAVELKRKEVKRNRQPDPETVQIANEVEHLRTTERLSWSQTAEEMRRRHPTWFASDSPKDVLGRCQKAYRRVIERKKS